MHHRRVRRPEDAAALFFIQQGAGLRHAAVCGKGARPSGRQAKGPGQRRAEIKGALQVRAVHARRRFYKADKCGMMAL